MKRQKPWFALVLFLVCASVAADLGIRQKVFSRADPTPPSRNKSASAAGASDSSSEEDEAIEPKGLLAARKQLQRTRDGSGRGTLNGIILEADGRACLEPAEVNIRRTNPEDINLTQTTDADGRFRFAGLPLGVYDIVVSVSGMWYQQSERIGFDGNVCDVVVQLPSLDGYTATVRDTRGYPVQGAHIVMTSVWPEDPFTRPSIGVGVTDGTGFLRIRMTERPVKVRVDGFDHGHYQFPQDVSIPSDSNTANFVVAPAGVASGRMVGLDGMPVGAGRWVHVSLGNQIFSYANTNEDGSFEVSVPLDGTAVLGWSGQPELTEKDSQDLPVIVETRLEGVRSGDRNLVLAMKRVPRDQSLTIKVEDPDGRPAKGARVTLWAEDRGMENQTGMIGIDGIATFEGLVARPVDVRVEPTEESFHAKAWVPFVTKGLIPAGQTVSLKIRVGKLVPLLMRFPDGSYAGEAEVSATIGENGWDRVDWDGGRADESGKYLLPVDASPSFHTKVRVSIARGRDYFSGDSIVTGDSAGLIVDLVIAPRPYNCIGGPPRSATYPYQK